MNNNISFEPLKMSGKTEWGQNPTLDLLRIIGTPHGVLSGQAECLEQVEATQLYDLSFANRIELLFLRALERQGRLNGLETKKQEMELRATTTRKIAAETSWILSQAGVKHVVFKSIKPFPATPNDTDVLCLGDEQEYQKGIQALTQAHYVVQIGAPMQTVLYHPSGEGKVGPGKKGGTYYIDFYRGVAVDHYEYVHKEALKPYCIIRKVEDFQTVLLSPEPELAIVMFHNVFPEKTCHLEQFYLFLYAIKTPEFDWDLFIDFVEKNCLSRALKANLTIFELLHRKAFGFIPGGMDLLLRRWGRIGAIAREVVKYDYQMQYIFPNSEYWLVFFSKLQDYRCWRSLLNQFKYMLNPADFIEVVNSLYTRMISRDIYGHQ